MEKFYLSFSEITYEKINEIVKPWTNVPWKQEVLATSCFCALDVTEFCRTTKTLLDFDIGVS